MTGAGKKRLKWLGAGLFVLYLILLIYYLFLAEEYGRGLDGSVYSWNLKPFREIRRYLTYYRQLGVENVILNLAGNVIGFMPFGALLPVFAGGARKCRRVVLLSFLISALVEFSQLILQAGCFDVDDMILNTLGGLLGYLVFSAGYRIYQRMLYAAK